MCCDTTVGSHWPLLGLSETYTSYQITVGLTGLAKFNGLRGRLSTSLKDRAPELRAGREAVSGSGQVGC